MIDALGYYQILNINFDADIDVIKSGYKQLAKQWHPDYNDSDNSLEMFQKISVAYDILKDTEKRLTYDLLNLVYGKKDFPDMFSLQPYKSQKNKDNINVRALNLKQVTSMGYKFVSKEDKYVASFDEALKIEFSYSLKNWLLGWWSLYGFEKTFTAIKDNIKNTDSIQDNFKLLLHNGIAYYQDKDYLKSYQSMCLAGKYANNTEKNLINKFIHILPDGNYSQLSDWKFFNLKYVQYIFPVFLAFVIFIPSGVKYVTEADLLKYFAKSNEIKYYQEVHFTNSGETVDDMVVAKVLNISVDTRDLSKLYHAKKRLDVMVGPDHEFDVLKTIPANRTVRITGITPDDKWYRIMLDNGDMGFVPKEDVVKGIGQDIPNISKIYTGIR